MKCDELKSLWVYSRDIDENCDEEFVNFAKENGYEELVAKSDVDAAIAELKAENRRLKRALWLARAISAINAVGEIHNVIVCMRERHPKMSLSNTEAQEQVWKNVARKCRAKAEQYK